MLLIAPVTVVVNADESALAAVSGALDSACMLVKAACVGSTNPTFDIPWPNRLN